MRGQFPDGITTEYYCKHFNPKAYKDVGADYFNPSYYNPKKLRIPDEKIDRTYDYDFDHLEMVEKYLLKVNRKSALIHIFANYRGCHYR